VFSLYAAGSGQEALDRLYDGDRNPNSVFSRVLVPALTRPGIDLATLAIEVREEVARIARGAGYGQRPAYYDETIGGRIYLNGEPPVNAGAADEAAWSFVKDTRDAEQLRRFIAQYPASPRRREVEERLKALEQNVAMTSPARPGDSQQQVPAERPPPAPAADEVAWGFAEGRRDCRTTSPIHRAVSGKPAAPRSGGTAQGA
jgi:hypothetical protein